MGDKGKGLLSYLLGWIGGLIVLCAMKNNTKRDVMNAGQGIVLSVGYAALSIITSFVGYFIPFVPFISGIVGILYLVALIFAIVNVVTDKDPKLPVIGDVTESLFAKQLAAAPEYATPAGGANFDPNTGQPINPQPQANFDPNTGEPLNKAPEAKFDPNTGEPIKKEEPVQPEQTETAEQPEQPATEEAKTEDAAASNDEELK